MNELEFCEESMIDLGQASAETKGNALFDIDVSGGQRLYAAGIAED